MSDAPKFCIHCAHCVRIGPKWLCGNSKITTADPVDGANAYRDTCAESRADADKCGPDAANFKPKA